MKQNKNLPVFSQSIKDNKLILTFEYNIGGEALNRVSVTFSDIMGMFRDQLIDALKARMAECVHKLTANLSNVIACNPTTIVYEEENGHQWKFNHHSYSFMEKILQALTDHDWQFLQNPGSCSQLMKAIAVYDIQPIKGGYSKDDLISCLMEVVECGPQPTDSSF